MSVLHSHAEPVAAWEKARDEEQSIANLEIAYTCLLSLELCPRRRHDKGARPGTLPFFSSKENMRTRLGYTLTLLGSRPMVSEEEEGHSRRANHHEVEYYVGAANIGNKSIRIRHIVPFRTSLTMLAGCGMYCRRNNDSS